MSRNEANIYSNPRRLNQKHQKRGEDFVVDGDELARQWAKAKEAKGCLPAILLGLSPAIIYLITQLAQQANF